jgi:type IV pilus assembly protein PilO
MAAKKGGTGLENLSLPGKIAVAVVFMLVVGAAYFVVFFGEIDGSIAAQITAKDQKEAELEKAKAADQAYNKDLTELERRKQIAIKQKKILPDTAEWAPFLDTIQRSATISGITLSGWEPKGEVAEDFYVRVPMEVTVTGRYHQIAKFFATVGQSDRIINMADIAMEIDSSTSNRKADSSVNEGEESVIVDVKAMATAFRAVNQEDGAAAKRGRRGRTGRQ